MASTTVGVPGFVGVSVMKNGEGVPIALHPSYEVVDKVSARFVPDPSITTIAFIIIFVVHPPVYVPGAAEYVELVLVPIKGCGTSTIFDKVKNVIISVPNNILDHCCSTRIRIAISVEPMVV